MNKLKVKYTENYSGEEISIPRKGDIGIDVYADEEVFIPVGECALIGLGISVEIPEGYWISFRDRSSMSKYTHVLAGVIDTSYRGPLKVRMLCHTVRESNLNGEDLRVHGVTQGVKISPGDKIAQMILCRDFNSEFEVESTDELSQTERGEGGFGSTGS